MGKKIDLDEQRGNGIISRSKKLRHQRNQFNLNESPSFSNDEQDQDYQNEQEETNNQENFNEQESEKPNYLNDNQDDEQYDEESEEYDSQEEMMQNKEKQIKKSGKAIKKTATILAIKFLVPKKFKIIFVAVLLLVVFPLLLAMMALATSGNISSSMGLSGYDYYAGACDKVRVKGGNLISMEEYVAGVVINEVGGFTQETLKAFAIGARTYVIQGASKSGDTDDCYYDVTNTSDSFQVYTSDKVPDNVTQAVNETRGIIITIDNKPKMFYDASCIYTAAQARSKTPSETFDDNYVYIRYGEKTINGDNYQKIDKEKAKSIGTLNYYINKAENGTACSGNHGWGMSQNGSAYLEAYEGYNYEKIINYYYQNKEKLVSIYKGATSGGSYSGDYPIDPNNELYSNNKFLINTSLSNVLSNNGSSVEEFNEYLKSEIEKAGVGTREASVAAAVTLIGSLAEQGYKINYQWGGIHTELGINSQYGTPVGTGSCDGSYAAQGYDPSVCRTNYKWYGFDCGGFVTWAIYNGMQGSNSPGGVTVSRSNIFSYSANNKISLNSNKAVCKIGGVLDSTGHIVLVVGHDDVNKQYIVAEATGSRLDEGRGGVKLSHYPYGAKGYWCGNLDEMYGD